MVNFMCQLNWAMGCLDSWQNIISEYVCFWKRLAFEFIDGVWKISLAIAGGTIQSMEGLNRTKMMRKCKFALCLSQNIHLLLSLHIGAPGPQAFRVGLGLTCSVGSQNFGLELQHGLSWVTTGFPCRWLTVGLFSLCNCELILHNVSFQLSIYILLAWFPWRTQTNTEANLE